MGEFKEFMSSIGMSTENVDITPPEKEMRAGSLVQCMRYKDKRRGSIVCSGEVMRMRQNGTFDILYEDGLKEIGVNRNAIVRNTPVQRKRTLIKVVETPKTPKPSKWWKAKASIRLLSVLDQAREHAAQEEQLLLNDALRQVRKQISKQEKRGKGGHLKGEAGMTAVDALKDIRGGKAGRVRKQTCLLDEVEAKFSLLAVSKHCSSSFSSSFFFFFDHTALFRHLRSENE
jgi:hypothetical protein